MGILENASLGTLLLFLGDELPRGGDQRGLERVGGGLTLLVRMKLRSKRRLKAWSPIERYMLGPDREDQKEVREKKTEGQGKRKVLARDAEAEVRIQMTESGDIGHVRDHRENIETKNQGTARDHQEESVPDHRIPEGKERHPTGHTDTEIHLH
jgi:hypothetical protein